MNARTAVSEPTSPGRSYSRARESLSALVRSLSPAQLQASVPACPGWSVHDVVGHVAGVAADAVNGVSPGASMDDWTARHVTDRADVATTVVLREWERSASQFEVLLDKGEMQLPAQLLDVVSHEQDIRGAIDRAGNRDEPVIVNGAALMGQGWLRKIDSAVLDPLAIVDAGGAVSIGPDTAPVRFTSNDFETFRSVFGRRSAAQLTRRFSGTDDPQPYIDLLCIFGPSASDIVE